jgi:hypothetical protein
MKKIAEHLYKIVDEYSEKLRSISEADHHLHQVLNLEPVAYP